MLGSNICEKVSMRVRRVNSRFMYDIVGIFVKESEVKRYLYTKKRNTCGVLRNIDKNLHYFSKFGCDCLTTF